MHTQPRSSARAFTLVELLIVVAIISVLMSLMLPSLAAARENAMQTQCKANLKSQHQGFVGYCLDHKERPPVIYYSTTVPAGTTPLTWYYMLSQYIYPPGSIDIRPSSGGTLDTFITTTAGNNLNRIAMRQKAFRCPSTEGLKGGVPWGTTPGVQYYWPSYTTVHWWAVDKFNRPSCGGNWQAYISPNHYLPTNDWNMAGPGGRGGGRYVLIADGAYPNTLAGGPIFYTADNPLLKTYDIRFHAGTTNALLGDGSVATTNSHTQSTIGTWMSTPR